MSALEIKDLLGTALSMRASDLHLTVGVPPSARVDGVIVPIGDRKLDGQTVRDTAFSIMKEREIAAFEEKGEVDFAYSLPGVARLRINVYHQRGSTAVAIRFLNQTIPAAKELGIPDSVVEAAGKKRGLILVTGATGSGKSTTLASLLDIINTNRSEHIITLEDPVEYLHQHKKSIVNQREMGSDSLNYANALRAALRQDPDVILVGEMRDLETISIAVTAAETGHLVFSTLHTVGAANTIDRIIDVFPPYQQQQIRTQLADVLVCIVSQQLMPKRSGRGRVAAFEVLVLNSAARNMIRENKTFQIQSVMQTNRKAGMMTMDDALSELYMAGEIDHDTAIGFAQDQAAMAKRLI